MITLALDASTYEGSVALLDGARVLAESTAAMRGRDQERLMPAVAETLRRADVPLARVDRIVCGAGPGSFTSLRIAASLAKGMATGASKPLYAVSSLALIVAGNVDEDASRQRYLAVMDALRDERFVAVLEHRGDSVSAADFAVVPAADVPRLAQEAQATVVGPLHDGNWAPHARGVRLMLDTIRLPVSLADWEPAYGRLAEAQAKWERTHSAPLPK